MKFKCPKCKSIIFRDMRKTAEKNRLTKRGYKSYCIDYQAKVYLKKVSK